MGDLTFPKEGKITLPTKYHGDVTLSKGKWNDICSKPERAFYRFNGEKIATTLINPDNVRYHHREEKQFFYYKRFNAIKLNDTVEIDQLKYFAVIINAESKRVCTIYPVAKPREGNEFKGA